MANTNAISISLVWQTCPCGCGFLFFAPNITDLNEACASLEEQKREHLEYVHPIITADEYEEDVPSQQVCNRPQHTGVAA